MRRLPDRIRPGVRVLFVGINPGLRSSAIGHHFAGYSNRFWKLLYDAGLVPHPLTCEEDVRLPEWGYGLTNLVARPSAGMDELGLGEFRAGRRRLLAKIRRVRPKVVALVGVTVYRSLFLSRGRSGLAYNEKGWQGYGSSRSRTPAAATRITPTSRCLSPTER
jgi:double-stranded uracil-DNA glycosylase